MKWITLHHARLDHIASSWLILRFIDPSAEISFVHSDDINKAITEKGIVTFDVGGSEYTLHHNPEECLFDLFIRKHGLADPPLAEVAHIVRSAVTGRFHLAPQAAGLAAVAAGMFHANNDQLFLQQFIPVLDALYSWASRLGKPLHDDSDAKLLELFHRFITQKYADRARKPLWVKEIAAIVQDGVDTKLNLGLADLAERLHANPGTLVPHPDQLRFGEEMRRQRIEKALQLMEEEQYSLAEIAYLTGFSDQGHFSRIFGKHYGKTPTGHLKTIRAQKGREEDDEEEYEDD
ncbi:chromate resistance protein ChrB domain-containing protein [Chitinophaga sp. GCM10012297]|uniref:Chromate resistance protein n=1 Tax=Chitinophaga chungangae TaxID=2821488 RepID=A0ABS3YAY8_9BACT|nr:chromate resistance protein ChrB domain-containing protein [Chitinophaga chungangae]MBO9151843.1 chromate resistance protein [Chitinophaga chungangae]